MYIAYIGGMKDHPKYLSLSVYFSGCDANPKCKGCHNPELHNPYYGYKTEIPQLVDIVLNKLKLLPKPVLAFLGGEPLAPYNREAVKEVARAVKTIYPESLILLFSWRMPEDIYTEKLLDHVKYIDEFVLGRFDITKKTDDFPASSNQIYITKDEFLRRVNNADGIGNERTNL